LMLKDLRAAKGYAPFFFDSESPGLVFFVTYPRDRALPPPHFSPQEKTP